jgi:Phytanoyl-CoA dioxygenase (PhyH)
MKPGMSTTILNKIFSDEKIIASRPLNLMGVQVLRTVGARLVHRTRAIDVLPGVEDKVRLVEREGVVLWPNFLPPDQFNALRDECLGLAGRHQGSYVRESGPNRDARVLASSLELGRVPALVRFLNDLRLKALLEGAERRRLGDLVRYAKIEHLTQGKDTGKQDPQTELHSDIYFTSHKAWFYLTDVTLASGPLAFVKGTHLLTPSRLYRVYEHSVAMKPGDEPSRRVKPDEIASLPEETVVVCPANTLVVANTCGYHRRRQGVAGQERCSIHLEVRANPFRLDKRRRASFELSGYGPAHREQPREC